MEFSKKIVVGTWAWACILITAYYINGIINNKCLENSNIVLITSVVCVVLGYFICRQKQKDSRNKYKVDKHGNPFENQNQNIS